MRLRGWFEILTDGEAERCDLFIALIPGGRCVATLSVCMGGLGYGLDLSLDHS